LSGGRGEPNRAQNSQDCHSFVAPLHPPPSTNWVTGPPTGTRAARVRQAASPRSSTLQMSPASTRLARNLTVIRPPSRQTERHCPYAWFAAPRQLYKSSSVPANNWLPFQPITVNCSSKSLKPHLHPIRNSRLTHSFAQPYHSVNSNISQNLIHTYRLISPPPSSTSTFPPRATLYTPSFSA
jgi:hypothetical protein